MQKLILLILATMAACNIAYAASYYVATDGNDTYNGLYPSYQGGSNGPRRHINQGISLLTAGDTLFIRAGTYTEVVSVGKSGTSSGRITISGYPGETVIVDGQHSIPGSPGVRSWDPLFNIKGSYVTARDLQIINSNGTGLEMRGNYDSAINVQARLNNEQGILMFGSYDLADNCDVYGNAYSNYGGTQNGGWAGGIMMCQGANHCTAQNCRSWENWGEGISSWSGSSGNSAYNTIQDCISYNNYATQIYLSNTQHCLVQRNLLYATPGNVTQKGAQAGIMVGDELTGTLDNDSNTIINNFILGCKHNFYSWRGPTGAGLRNFLIAFNTFVNAVAGSNFQVDAADHTGCRVMNNIFLQEDAVPITGLDSNLGIVWTNNLWSKSPQTQALGTGSIVINPHLVKAGATAPGALTPEYFKISITSPARGRALSILEVVEDFFKTPRGTLPDIGGHQYVEAPGSLLDPPANLKVIGVVE
jgi:hypothetical protein